MNKTWIRFVTLSSIIYKMFYCILKCIKYILRIDVFNRNTKIIWIKCKLILCQRKYWLCGIHLFIFSSEINLIRIAWETRFEYVRSTCNRSEIGCRFCSCTKCWKLKNMHNIRENHKKLELPQLNSQYYCGGANIFVKKCFCWSLVIIKVWKTIDERRI